MRPVATRSACWTQRLKRCLDGCRVKPKLVGKCCCERSRVWSSASSWTWNGLKRGLELSCGHTKLRCKRRREYGGAWTVTFTPTWAMATRATGAVRRTDSVERCLHSCLVKPKLVSESLREG